MSAVIIGSSNSDPTKAVAGNTITVTLTQSNTVSPLTLTPTGTIAAQTESANEQLKRYKEDLAKLETRMTAVMERYTRQFTAMDSLVGEATATRNRLKSTFDAWTKNN